MAIQKLIGKKHVVADDDQNVLIAATPEDLTAIKLSIPNFKYTPPITYIK